MREGVRIVERLTRTGNEILYDVAVHDPESFIEPWVMTPRTLRLTRRAWSNARRAW